MIVANLRPWSQEDFRELYAEALAQFERLQEYCAATLRECNGGSNLPGMKENFELADARYKKAVALTGELSLQFCKKVKDKKLSDWTRQEFADNALIRSLDGMISTSMHHLQTAYRPWLAQAQFVAKTEE